jgi:hypothetical protein
MHYTIEQQIEFLCEREFPDYSAVKPDRVRALAAMSVPGEGPQANLWNGPYSRGRKIGSEEQKEILEKAEAFKKGLRALKPDEVSALLLAARDKDWRAKHLTIEEAAKKIAEKIFPGQDYPWEVDQRNECAEEYRMHLKAAALSGQVPFINPHRKTRFDHTHLSAERFPEDGLIENANLHLCLLPKHKSAGHFSPPKPISKAPAPIKPLSGISTVDFSPRYLLVEPDWKKWGLMDKVRLWKAACLAVNIEPPQENKEDLWEEVQLKGLPDKFQRMWEILNADNLLSRLNYVGTAGRMLHQIDIGWFALWAVTKGLDIPDPLIAIAARFKSMHELSAATIAKAQQQPMRQKEISAEPVKPLQKPLEEQQHRTVAKRIKPRGGDSLTPMIWDICYDLHEAGQDVKPRYVMAELRKGAEKMIWPLAGVVADGVKYEYEKGDEIELNAEQLRGRIREWRKIAIGE